MQFIKTAYEDELITFVQSPMTVTIEGYATWQEKPNSSRDSNSFHVHPSSRSFMH